MKLEKKLNIKTIRKENSIEENDAFIIGE